MCQLDACRSQLWLTIGEGCARSRVIAGKQSSAFGKRRGGKFAAVTNFRDPAATGPAPRTRGELTLDYLLADESPEYYLHTVSQRADEYAGFNLLLGDALDLWYFSNSTQQGGLRNSAPMKLKPGVYGLSNALLE